MDLNKFRLKFKSPKFTKQTNYGRFNVGNQIKRIFSASAGDKTNKQIENICHHQKVMHAPSRVELGDSFISTFFSPSWSGQKLTVRELSTFIPFRCPL